MSEKVWERWKRRYEAEKVMHAATVASMQTVAELAKKLKKEVDSLLLSLAKEKAARTAAEERYTDLLAWLDARAIELEKLTKG